MTKMTAMRKRALMALFVQRMQTRPMYVNNNMGDDVALELISLGDFECFGRFGDGWKPYSQQLRTGTERSNAPPHWKSRRMA
jgi:hypothetical protein